ncbi:hypothetical protein PO909_027240, partial [Leuciscus waleckii]
QDCGQNWYCNHFQITVERCIPPGVFPVLRFRNVRHFLTDTFVAAAVVTRAELATRMPKHY